MTRPRGNRHEGPAVRPGASGQLSRQAMVNTVRDDRRVEIGRIVAPCGLKGAVKVLAYEEDCVTVFRKGGRFYLETKGPAAAEPLQVESARTHKRSAVVKFCTIDTIEAVKALVGKRLFIEARDLPRLGPGEYYWYQLIGLEVVTVTGRRLGTLRRIFPTGSNDVYVVADGQREVLVPALRDVIQEVNLLAGTMIVRPMEGLIEG